MNWYFTCDKATPVLIEAESRQEARERAHAIGLFNPVEPAAESWLRDYTREVPEGTHLGHLVVHYDDRTSKVLAC